MTSALAGVFLAPGQGQVTIPDPIGATTASANRRCAKIPCRLALPIDRVPYTKKKWSQPGRSRHAFLSITGGTIFGQAGGIEAQAPRCRAICNTSKIEVRCWTHSLRVCLAWTELGGVPRQSKSLPPLSLFDPWFQNAQQVDGQHSENSV